KPRNHPAFGRVEKVSVCRPNMNLRCRERSAAQDFLPDEPFIIVLVKIGFETWIWSIIRGCPLPHIANHLVASRSALPLRKATNRSDAPALVIEQIRILF